MPTSEDYFAQLRTLYANVKDAYDRLNRAQSAADREVSAIYHEIERTEFDDDSAIAVVLLLQNSLRKRRAIKDEFRRLAPIYEMFNANIGPTEERYFKIAAKSAELRHSLNVTLTISDIYNSIT
ncbi:hypothetical protein ACFCP7_00410 [Paenibacillus elgii]